MAFIPTLIDILVALLVFGVTVPSILISIPPRMRAIRDKYPYQFLIRDRQIDLHDVLIHRNVVILIVLSIISLVPYLIPPPSFMCNTNGVGWWCSWRDAFVDFLPWFASTILCLNVGVTALFFRVLISYTQEHILHDLANQIRRQAREEGGRIDKAVLTSIADFGQFCEAGRDKKSVLDVLVQFADSELTLNSDSRIELARTVSGVVVGGNEHNYIYAINVLRAMFQAASQARIPENEPEGIGLELLRVMMLRELENVMTWAFSLRNPLVTAAISTGYDMLALQNPVERAYAFLRIGKIVLGLHEMRHAQAILDKFHTKILGVLDSSNNDPNTIPEEIHIFFGLLAHFWDRGDAARQHALQKMDALPQEHVDQRLQDAKTFLQISGHLETADCIEQMLFDKNQLQYVKQILLEINELQEEQRQRILIHHPSMDKLRSASLEDIMACGVREAVAKSIIQKINPPPAQKPGTFHNGLWLAPEL